MDRCSLCRFYHQIKPGSPRSLGNGECRYRPPVVPTGSHDRFHADFAIFPVVLENDWCGEFAPRVAQVAVNRVDQANRASMRLRNRTRQSRTSGPSRASAKVAENRGRPGKIRYSGPNETFPRAAGTAARLGRVSFDCPNARGPKDSDELAGVRRDQNCQPVPQ